MTHPKIIGLSDKAFRLWVWGLSYCQLHLTDGLIPSAAMPARMKRAAPDLVANRLWKTVEAFGYVVHDYLDWNDSKELIVKKRTDAKERMAAARERGSQHVHERSSRELLSRTPLTEVLRGVGNKNALEEKEDVIGKRAGELLNNYAQWYSQCRQGARLRLLRNALEFNDALGLCETWDDARLEKLARVILTTDEPFIANTDRSFKIFAMKASWADDRLTAAEKATAC